MTESTRGRAGVPTSGTARSTQSASVLLDHHFLCSSTFREPGVSLSQYTTSLTLEGPFRSTLILGFCSLSLP